MKRSAEIKAIQSGQQLLLSVVKPDAGFHPGVAMMRNRYIYAQSEAVVGLFSDCFFATSYRTHIVSSAPEIYVVMLMSFKYN